MNAAALQLCSAFPSNTWAFPEIGLEIHHLGRSIEWHGYCVTVLDTNVQAQQIEPVTKTPMEDNMRSESLYDSAPVILLTFGEDRMIVEYSEVAATMLGVRARRTIDDVVDADSALLLNNLLVTLRRNCTPFSCLLTLCRSDGGRMTVTALVDRVTAHDGRSLLRITALYAPESQCRLDDLMESEALLRSFVETSSEAMWCIEFSEEVDLTLGEHETIRQVFENECHWRLCNESMARIYNLPPGLDFNKQPVRHYFPRSTENEAFIRQIIASDFAIDHVLSIDTCHDGSTIYVENTVRADVDNGRLLRLWGTVRDVTADRQTNHRLAKVAQDVNSILNALPDAVLVVDRNHKAIAVNPSFETLFGWAPQQLLGQNIQPIIDLESPLPGGRRWYGVTPLRWTTSVRTQSDRLIACDVHSAPVCDEAPDRYILVLRPAGATHSPPDIGTDQTTHP